MSRTSEVCIHMHNKVKSTMKNFKGMKNKKPQDLIVRR